MTDKASTNIRPNMDKYQDAITASGTKSKICGDEVSVALSGLVLDEVYHLVAKVTGANRGELEAKYAERNAGQQRMTLGNILRGAVRSTKDPEKTEKARKVFDTESAKLRKVADKRQKGLAAEKAADTKARADKKAADAKAKAEAKTKAKAETPPKAEKAPKAKNAPKRVSAPKAPKKPDEADLAA